MEIVVKPSPSEHEETSGGSEGRATLCIRKNLTRALELAIFVGCVGGFFYQSTEFVTNFYKYPTVLDMDVQRMDEFPTPALTLCSKYLFDFVKYCGMHPTNCEKPANKESFCLENPHKCNGNETDAVTPKLFPTYKRMGSSWSEFPKISLTIPQVFHTQDIIGFEGPFFNNMHLRSGYEACYRAGNGFGPSGLQKTPNIKAIAIPWKKFWVKFMKKKNIFYLPEAEPYVVLYIHSSLLSFRTSQKPITLRNNIEYVITINLEQVQLLPHPYESDCVDYEKLWKKNNKTGPVSHEMCEYRCDWLSDDDAKYYGQSGDYYAYNQPDRCDVLSKNPTSNEPEFKKCLCKEKCKNDCLKLNYGFSVYESNDRNMDGDSSDLSAIRVDLIIEKENVRVLSFTPKYMDVEVFSYVGGFMGCWLGISLWSSTGILWEGISAFAATVKKKRKILGIASKNLNDQP